MSQIIIKRKKNVIVSGHHGGAWKVAYADFVTAMMAFFLLMWLLNATTEEQRKGIADYFNPNIPIAAVSGGGSDALSGDSIFVQDVLSKDGSGAKDGTSRTEPSHDKNAQLQERVDTLNHKIMNQDQGLSDHVVIALTPEGLTIELTDKSDRPLFERGSAQPSPILIQLIELLTDAFEGVENGIKIVGHTDASQYSTTSTYTNWELSIDRANTARQLLTKRDFPDHQIREVSGKADLAPLSEDVMAPENRRISITLLNE